MANPTITNGTAPAESFRFDEPSAGVNPADAQPLPTPFPAAQTPDAETARRFQELTHTARTEVVSGYFRPDTEMPDLAGVSREVAPGQAPNGGLLPLPPDIGLFKNPPIRIHALTSHEAQCLVHMSHEDILLRLAKYSDEIHRGKPDFLGFLANYDGKSPFVALAKAMHGDGRYEDVYLHVLKDLMHRLRSRDSEVRSRYEEGAAELLASGATPESIKEYLVAGLQEFVPYARGLTELILREGERAAEDPAGVALAMAPQSPGVGAVSLEYARFPRLIFPLEYYKILFYLTGSEEGDAALSAYALPDPVDALKLIFFHGPRYHLAASVIYHAPRWETLPVFILNELDESVKDWMSALDASTKALALLAVVCAHVTRNQALADLIRGLSRGESDQDAGIRIRQAMREAFPELAALLSDEGIPLSDRPLAEAARPGYENLWYYYAHFAAQGYKPSAAASLRHLKDVPNVQESFQFMLKDNHIEESRKTLLRNIRQQKQWSEPVLQMAIELALFFLEDRASVMRLKEAIREGGAKGSEAVVQIYRQYRPFGAQIVDELERSKIPLKNAAAAPAKALAPKLQWRSKTARGHLHRISQKMGGEFRGFEKLCEDVFDFASLEIASVESLLERLSRHPGLQAEFKALAPGLAHAGPEEKRHWLFRQSNWAAESWGVRYGRWLRTGETVFEPLKDYLSGVVEVAADLDREPYEEMEVSQKARLSWRELLKKASALGFEESLRRYLLILFAGTAGPEGIESLLAQSEEVPLDALQAQLAALDDPDRIPSLKEVRESFLKLTRPGDWRSAVRDEIWPYFASLFEGRPHPDLREEGFGRFDYFLGKVIATVPALDLSEPWIEAARHAPNYSYFVKVAPPAYGEDLRPFHERRVNSQLSMTFEPERLGALARDLDGQMTASSPDKRDFLHSLLATQVEHPLEVLSLCHWLQGFKDPESQAQVAYAMSLYRDYLKSQRVRLHGNVLFNFLDRTSYAFERLISTVQQARPGDEVFLVPHRLEASSASPSHMFRSRDGGLRFLDVHTLIWEGMDSQTRLFDRLNLANRQLGSFLPEVEARRIAHLRVYLSQDHGMGEFLLNLEGLLSNHAFEQLDEITLSVSPWHRTMSDPALSPTKLFKADLNPVTAAPLHNRVSVEEAEAVAGWLWKAGSLMPRDLLMAKIHLASKTPEQISRLEARNFRAELRPKSTELKPRYRKIRLTDQSFGAGGPFKSCGEELVPHRIAGLGNYFTALGPSLPLKF